MNGKRLILALVPVLAVLIFAPPPAGASVDGFSIQEELAKVVRKAGDAGTFSGTALVARHGEILYSGSYGMADRATSFPNSVETKLLLASVTKQLTAMLVLRQVERGNMKLADPVRKYLPTAPATWNAITIHHLLNHTAGLPDYLNSSYLDEIRHLDLLPSQIIERFRGQKLNFTPGKSYAYSNSAFLVLGTILETITGLKWPELLAREIFLPLDMRDSGVEPAVNLPAPYATPYRINLTTGNWFIPPGMHPSILFAVGDIYSTVEDLYRWNRALVSGVLLGPDLTKKMFTPGLGSYGYGIRVTSTPQGRRELWHTGHVTGFSNYIGHYIDDDLAVVVLGNVANSPSTDIGRALSRVALGASADSTLPFILEDPVEMREF